MSTHDNTDTDAGTVTEIDIDQLASEVAEELSSQRTIGDKVLLSRREAIALGAGSVGLGAVLNSAVGEAEAQSNGVLRGIDQIGTSSDPIGQLYVENQTNFTETESFDSVVAEEVNRTRTISVDEGVEALKTAVESLSAGDTVKIGEGTFSGLTSDIVIPADDITIKGTGRHETVIEIGDHSTSVFDLDGHSGVSIEDLSLKEPNAGDDPDTPRRGVISSQASDRTLGTQDIASFYAENIYVEGFQTAIEVLNVTEEAQIETCFGRNQLDNAFSVHASGAEDKVSRNVTFECCFAMGADEVGFEVDSSSTSGYTENINFVDCIAYNNGMHGFEADDYAVGVTYRGCHSYDNGRANYYTKDSPGTTDIQFIGCSSENAASGYAGFDINSPDVDLIDIKSKNDPTGINANNKGIDIKNPTILETTEEEGIKSSANQATVSVGGGRIESTEKGAVISSQESIIVRELTVKDIGQGAGDYPAIKITNSDYGFVTGCSIIDSQDIPTLLHGVLFQGDGYYKAIDTYVENPVDHCFYFDEAGDSSYTEGCDAVDAGKVAFRYEPDTQTADMKCINCYAENPGSGEAVAAQSTCTDFDTRGLTAQNVTTLHNGAGTRSRWEGVIGGGPLGGVDLGSTTGQFEGDEAMADGTTGAAHLHARWNGSEWQQSDGSATIAPS